mmetsp:Transcript_18130/g.30973  ORF Transcript_18130/g.30973 Transcript_18130/m.30973 type:complete len:134 (+) Transcript_18130:427-828(+)
MIGSQLEINAQGLVNTKRNKKDGCTIIGSLDANQMTGELYNDFVIHNVNGEGLATDNLNPVDSTSTVGGIGKRHLVIKYSEFDRNYYLRDLGDGSGTFIRIDNHKDLILKHGFIISYGDSHMVVQLSSEISSS